MIFNYFNNINNYFVLTPLLTVNPIQSINTKIYYHQLLPQSLRSSLALNALMDGAVTTSTGSKFQLLTTLTLKVFALLKVFQWPLFL